MSWLTAEQALDLLGTKPQTLYANVSRGRIRAKPDPSDIRRSLYFGEDVRRLATRHAGRRKSEAVAADAIEWGDPVLPSALSTVWDGRLFYRGRDAARLSQGSTLEEVAGLLWDMKEPLVLVSSRLESGQAPSLERTFVALARHATVDLPSLGRSPLALKGEAEHVLATVAEALAPGAHDMPLHERLASSWHRPEAADIIRRALVLFADHELNASTFAARITASAGAALSAAALSGISTLTGPLHGGAWQGVSLLIDSARKLGSREAVRRYLGQGHSLPAFGHPLYPHGDVRAAALLPHFKMPAIFEDLRGTAEKMIGERANADFALSALVASNDLPDNAPIIIFSLARTVGWLAHAMEQASSGRLIRPRARYVGNPLEA
jgi:citrate synthase